MCGETGLLVLIAPLTWWPSAEELHCYPFDASRTFFSVITNAKVVVGAAERIVNLSRLGKSVIMSATLTTSSVCVYNPFSGKNITLQVRAEISEDALSSGILLRDLVEANRVRIEAAEIVPLSPLVKVIDTPSEKHIVTAVNDIVEYLQRGRRQEICSVLFTGDPMMGKTHIMQSVVQHILPIFSVHDVRYVVERRDVNIVRLLQMDEREAVMMIRCAFAVPPVESSTGTHGVLLLVTIDSVDLLWSASNSLVALVSHQLCVMLDELHEATESLSCRGVVLATATTTLSLPTALLSRLSSHRVHITQPLSRERQNCIDRALATVKNNGINTLHISSPRQQQNEDHLDVYCGLVGMNDVIRDLEEFVIWPLQHLPLLRRCGVMAPKGVVVCGPSGCGKTALLRALAKRLQSDSLSNVHVMLVDGLSLIEKEVGRTEKNIAALFSTARAMSPTALFLDNIDSLAPPRGQQMSEVSNTADRTLSTLLTEMDGISNTNNNGDIVFVVASAPTVNALDPAVRRPGRLDLHLILSLPKAEDLRLYLVQRVLACVAEYDEYSDREVTAEVSSVVDAYVGRWIEARPISPAEANAFVREFLLKMTENSNASQIDRLREALTTAASL